MAEDDGERIFVCGCGCSTFELYEGGEAGCAICGTIADTDGSWFRKPPEVPERDDPPMSDVQGNGCVDFARHRVKTLAAKENAKLFVVALDDGAVSIWADYASEDQRAWMLERLVVAQDLIKAQKVK